MHWFISLNFKGFIMKNIYHIILFLALVNSLSLSAQVGIGNTSPDSSSVLDLHNSENRGLLLPKSATVSAMSQSNRMTYYYNEFIYFKTDIGYNAISPWKYKYNGNTTNNLYYNLNGNIGIGNSNITVAPEAPLQIETDSAVSLASNGSLMIGESASQNMILNSTEIQTRNAGASSDLSINEEGGDIIFGDSIHPVEVLVTGKVQELDDATNTYYELVPKGIITAWFGYSTNIPKGWAVCDGGTYQNSNGSGTSTTPDLKGRFIVSVGNNGSSNYSAHDTGGEDKVSLKISEIPNHSHNARVTGSHSHGYTYETVNGRYEDLVSKPQSLIDEPDESNVRTRYTSTSYANISQTGGGTGAPHENRPIYYSLVFIMKL